MKFRELSYCLTKLPISKSEYPMKYPICLLTLFKLANYRGFAFIENYLWICKLYMQ